MIECTQGVEIRRMWSEQEMVCTFGGQMFPGTPDGMFESWDGALTCVQVVRVPLVLGMSAGIAWDTLAQTLLTKVVKSQLWLRGSRIDPDSFVIFCWLPYAIPEHVVEDAQALIQRVRALDARFSLRLRTPSDTSAVFPALFGLNQELRMQQRG